MRIFFKRIRKIIKYIPIIWENWYDWDYTTAINVFKFELGNIANHLESDNAYTVRAKGKAKRMRLAIKLLERAYNDYYMDEYYDKLESKYGKSTIDFIPLQDNEELFEMVTVHERELSEVEKKNYEIEKEILINEAVTKEEKTKRLVWRIIHQNIEHWWD